MIAGKKIAIIGAGIGGLAAALRLSEAGAQVQVFDMHTSPGGKMRTIPSDAGPVDAGPTVLTLFHVFEALFKDVGEDIHQHLTLNPLHTLARHFWDDGTALDLTIDRAENIDSIGHVFGPEEAQNFANFDTRARQLFEGFDAPMMAATEPNMFGMVTTVMRNPGLIKAMAPHRRLSGLLRRSFASTKMRQLMGRYATYVGGSPYQSPALLSLIWHAEAKGVWTINGGMHKLAKCIEGLAKARGASFQYQSPVRRISRQGGKVTGIETDHGFVPADAVLFNGDPRALTRGALGNTGVEAIATSGVEPRSLSAYVHAFAAAPDGLQLSHHNVFFGHEPSAEFKALAGGQRPTDATLYLCAQDFGTVKATDRQRFEIIMNGPPVGTDPGKEKAPCQTQTFNRLRQFGLRFDKMPTPDALTTPAEFNRLFPESLGSLYGRSPHGLTAGLKRPQARTKMPGLYLCGGGAHPGAGIPMATLSAKHAVDAILNDLALTSTSLQTATPGGTSTGSAPAGAKRSLS